jgi:hypothetical protein
MLSGNGTLLAALNGETTEILTPTCWESYVPFTYQVVLAHFDNAILDEVKLAVLTTLVTHVTELVHDGF